MMKTSTNAQSAPSPNGPNGDAKANGRNANGRFAAGNVGGPGNPFARRTAEFRKAIAESVTPEELRDMFQTIYIKARGGDLAAAKFLCSYLVGKPARPVDPDRLDIEEWNLFKEGAIKEELLPVVTQISPRLGLDLARAIVPAKNAEMKKQFGTMLHAYNKKHPPRGGAGAAKARGPSGAGPARLAGPTVDRLAELLRPPLLDVGFGPDRAVSKRVKRSAAEPRTR